MRGGAGDEDERGGGGGGGGSLDDVDPFFMALLRSRQRRFAECVDICTEILAVNPYDQVRLPSMHAAVALCEFLIDCDHVLSHSLAHILLNRRRG